MTPTFNAATAGGAAPLPGKLVIVEGVDGSGKSTQIDLVRKWLIAEGYAIAYSEWNSSPIVSDVTRHGKKNRLLSPQTFSLIHAADFADRYHRYILPALEAGAIVLVDRYVYTAFARDAARGVDRGWLRQLYSFATAPTVAFYFRVPLDEALKRILRGRPELKWYEAGMDLRLSDDPYESFRLFQARILEEYEAMTTEFGLTVIDATKPMTRQQREVRDIVRPHADGTLRAPPSAWKAVVRDSRIFGRYLDELVENERSKREPDDEAAVRAPDRETVP
ncbi:MAG TPA: thymidylate kinase [Myxococcota bacterium]|jgi:dTMP kinase|nr:thymidylate kinase [Myxococcota bacterium]